MYQKKTSFARFRCIFRKCKFTKICDQQQEDLEHFILICPAYKEQRMRTRKLQQPYQEDKINLIALFNNSVAKADSVRFAAITHTLL